MVCNKTICKGHGMKNLLMRCFLAVAVLISVSCASDFEKGVEADEKGDYKTAAKYYTKACDDGVIEGCFNLGVMYADGEGVKQNYNKAATLFAMACDGGIAGACNNLGLMFELGKGVKQDESAAAAYYQMACQQGEQIGCQNYNELQLSKQEQEEYKGFWSDVLAGGAMLLLQALLPPL